MLGAGWSEVGTTCGRSSRRTGYRRIQWWVCICYIITLTVQVPFLDQLIYVGPLVSSLGGAAICWIVGVGVASLLYLAGAKRFSGALLAGDPVAS